jgi:uncharacterized membrane protein/protein-disulfide isomerase
MKKQKEIRPLPFPVYFWTTVITAFSGLADAVYLAISHYRVYTSTGYKSFCAVSKSINCDTVSQSPFSIFLNVPVAIWGIFGYLFFLIILFSIPKASPDRTRLWPTLFMTALAFSIYSIILALVSMLYIRAYCIMCIASYAVNFLLLFLAWLIHRRFSNMSMLNGLKLDCRLLVHHKKKVAVFIMGFTLVLCVLVAGFPRYWRISPPPLSTSLPHGITEDGHPWIGAEEPKLLIVEFTDYQCFQCKKMHFYLRELVASYTSQIRLVHRNFPMDHVYNPLVKEPYHIGSGKMALLSLYAAQKNKFWEINDMLFTVDRQKGHFNIREMAASAGFDVYEFARSVKDRNLQKQLKSDILDGIKLGVNATPGYLINGKIYTGYIPADIIESAISGK